MSQPVRYAIIEDEAISARQLELSVARQRPDWQLAFHADSVETGIQALQQGPAPDLILADIQLGDGTSFDIFAQVPTPVPVIFTTAFDSYAIRAFQVWAVDYLLKPLNEGDLALALSKFEQRREAPYTSSQLTQLGRDLSRQPDRLLINQGDHYRFVPLDDIAFLISEDNYVFLYPRQGQRCITSYSNLAEAASRLPANRFFQISRNVLTSLSAIKDVSKHFRGRLVAKLLSNGQITEVTIPSARRDAFLEWLGG